MSDVTDAVQDIEFEETPDVAAWKGKAGHPAVMPSGAVVRIRVPNLAALAQSGELPNDLIRIAIPEVAGREPDPEDEEKALEAIQKLADFQSWITATAVVSPEIAEEDVSDLPTEDVEMIVAIATRQRDLDAVGNHIGGLEKSAKFRRFRGLTSGDEDLLG